MGSSVSTGAILFTDMVGSTDLRTRLGDDRADVLRKHHDELLADAVDAHRGEVLRWTGDGIKAAFATASDAVAAAVAMQRAVAAYALDDRAVAAFQVRIGLAAGEVIVDDGDHHGVAVIEAARLEAQARPGEILATDIVRILGARRANVAFEPLGERTLKGLDGPVLVHRVVDLSAAAVPALPRLLAFEQRLPLVGRDEQVALVRRAWGAASNGTPGLVVLRGESGMGKTRLLADSATSAHGDGAIVLAGACDSELGVPYEPFAAAFREVAALDASLTEAIEASTGPLARLFPGSTSSHTEGQPAMVRHELFEAVGALVRRLTRQHPVLLVLDDLQWATAPTILLLRHLVDDVVDQRLLVCAAYRDDSLGSGHPLREFLTSVRSAPSTTAIDLDALSEADMVRMVVAAAPDAAVDRVGEVARQVHRESAGNPFFATELLHHLASTGQLDRALAGADAGHLPIPDSVHDMITQRLARLPDGAQEMLTAAAVIGPTFELDLLADVIGRPADDVLDVLDEVCRAGITNEVGIDQFAFTHAIVRTTLLDELMPTRRARAHRKVAEALEARGAEQFDELAHHWQLAGVESKSTTHLARAARRDMVALAYESARARYQQVVDLLARDPHADANVRAEAWLGLGAAGRALADPTYTAAVSRAARLARTARNATLMAEAAAMSTWPGTFFFTADVPEFEFIELCEDALSLLDPTDPLRVRVLATLASHLTFSSTIERRRELITEATELVAQHGDPLLTANVLNAEFLCLWDASTFDRRMQVARELGRIGRATGDPEVEFLGEFFGSYCDLERGEVDSARSRLAQLGPVIDATQNIYFAFLTDRMLVTIDILQCRPGNQERVDGLLQRYGATHADTDGTWALQTGGLALQAGTLGDMVPALQAMTAGNLSRTWAAAHAMALVWAGDLAGAEEVLDRSTEVPRNYFWLSVMQVRAEVAAELGRLDLCRTMFDELAPYRGRIGITASGSLCYGFVSRTLGMLALALDDVDAATTYLREAVADADRIDAPHDAVAGRRLLATALLRSAGETGSTERAEAIELIDEAQLVAAKHSFRREIGLLDALADDLHR